VATKIKNWTVQSKELMFLWGAHTEELKTCISEKDSALRLAGAKIRNKPAGHKASATFIATLPEPALEVVRTWFLKKTTFEEKPTLSDSLKYFSTLNFEEYNNEKAKKYWRSILCSYCQKKPVEDVTNFINNTPKSSRVEEIELEINTSKIATDSNSLINCIEAVKTKKDLKEAEPLYLFVSGIIAATRNETKDIDTIIKKFNDKKFLDTKKIKELFEEIQKNFPHNQKALEIRTSHTAETFGVIDPEKGLALATITNHLKSGQFFARVEGVFIEEKFVSLSSQEARELFKFSGDITGYQNKLSGSHHDGEIGLWKVTHQNTEKKTQYLITEHHARVYEVIQIPHKSDDPESVRSWIQTSFKYNLGQFPIFELDDGLLVRAPWDLTDTSNTKFEKALEVYDELEAFLTPHGKKIVIGPLPAFSKKYDCAPIGTLIKRILRLHEESLDFPTFTKNQAQAAAEFLASQDFEILESNLSRTKTRLMSAADLREQVESCIQLVLAIPEVSEAVEGEKSKIIADFIKSRITEESTLTKLKNQQQQVTEAIELTQRNAKKLETDIANHLKNAFERASRDGAKTLADFAVFKSFLPNATNSIDIKKNQSISNLNTNLLKSTTKGNPIKTIAELSNSLSRAAIASSLSPQLIRHVSSALLASCAVGLIGNRRSSIAPTLASVFSSGIYCQLSIGADIFSPADLMTRPVTVFTPHSQVAMTLGEFVDFQNELNHMCIVDVLGSNRAPIDSYIPELIEHASNGKKFISIPWTDLNGSSRGGNQIYPIYMLLNFVSGKSTFPVSRELLEVIPLCEVSHKWGDEEDTQTNAKLPNRHIESEHLFELFESIKSAKLNVSENMRCSLLALGISEADASSLAQVAFANGSIKNKLTDIEGVAKVQNNALQSANISSITENNLSN
jgi:hypothetical protein